MANENDLTTIYGPPNTDGNHTGCECFTGYPVINPDGSCGCIDTLPAPIDTGGIKVPPGYVWNGRAWVPRVNSTLPYYPPTVSLSPDSRANAAQKPDAAAADDNTIFGMSPLLVVGLAAGALFLFSSMGNGKKEV